MAADALKLDEPDDAWIDDVVAFKHETLAEQRAPKKPPSSNGEDEPAAGTWPQPLDLQSLARREPEPPRFILTDWLPCGYATLFAGHGGVGKSGIALYLAVCIAAGVPFFGIEVQRRRVLYLSCEDREGVLHWRLCRICAHLNMDLARLCGWLDVLDLVGHDAVLWNRDPRTGDAITVAYGALHERVRLQQTEVLVVDSIADAFGGNENARGEVKRFVNLLVALVPVDAGAVLLVGHLPKPAARGEPTSEGYSGSTAWHNSVRARWYLYPETRQGEDGERAERTGDLILELQKSNLGRADQQMRFAWSDEARLFLGRDIVGETASDRGHRDRIERDAILAALRASIDPVPAATTGQRTAYHVLAARPEFPDSLRSGRVERRRFWRQIEALRAMGAIGEGSIRRADRHYMQTLVALPEGVRACGQ
jgi:RecA-family ATPase